MRKVLQFIGAKFFYNLDKKTLAQMENRVKADIWYVENWSFGLDLRIMWRTLLNMLRHNEENAY